MSTVSNDSLIYYMHPASQRLPLFLSKVQAGFPSPADDYIEGYLKLDDFLIKHPSSTYFVRATGDSMIEAGIFDNDILIVDKCLAPFSGKMWWRLLRETLP